MKCCFFSVEHERLQADVTRLARELDVAQQKIKTLESGAAAGGSAGRTTRKAGSSGGSLDELCGTGGATAPGQQQGSQRGTRMPPPPRRTPIAGPLAISGSHPNVADNNIVGLRQASIHSNTSAGLESPTRRYDI